MSELLSIEGDIVQLMSIIELIDDANYVDIDLLIGEIQRRIDDVRDKARAMMRHQSVLASCYKVQNSALLNVLAMQSEYGAYTEYTSCH